MSEFSSIHPEYTSCVLSSIFPTVCFPAVFPDPTLICITVICPEGFSEGVCYLYRDKFSCGWIPFLPKVWMIPPGRTQRIKFLHWNYQAFPSLLLLPLLLSGYTHLLLHLCISVWKLCLIFDRGFLLSTQGSFIEPPLLIPYVYFVQLFCAPFFWDHLIATGWKPTLQSLVHLDQDWVPTRQ